LQLDQENEGMEKNLKN